MNWQPENLENDLETSNLIILCLSGRSVRDDLITNNDWWSKTVILDGREAGKQEMIKKTCMLKKLKGKNPQGYI